MPSGSIAKVTGVVAKSTPIAAGLSQIYGLILSNDGKRSATIQLVKTVAGIIPDIQSPMSADEELFGHWEILPGEFIFVPVAATYGGMFPQLLMQVTDDHTLVVFGGPTMITWATVGVV